VEGGPFGAGGSASWASTPNPSKTAEITSISGLAQANTAWNIMKSKNKRQESAPRDAATRRQFARYRCLAFGDAE